MNRRFEKSDNVEVGTVASVSVERLVLDQKNPRLMIDDDTLDDTEIIVRLYVREDLSELLQSISANGYLDIEPLVVIETDGDKLIVLEGNRRLAAIRLLRDRALVQKIQERTGQSITVPSIGDRELKTLDEVSVYRVKDRKDARSYLGFKHINGPAKWDSYAKAKFAAYWYKDENITLDEIANQIGDRHNTIKRMVNAIYVLEQAERNELFCIADRATARFNFSHLYTALARREYMNFLGLSSSWTSYRLTENPVSQEYFDQLREVLRWIYGSEEDNVRPVVSSQNPDIKRLAAVLGSSEALAILRTKNALDDAFRSTIPASGRLSNALVHARDHVREAFTHLSSFDGQETGLAKIADEISVEARVIHEHLRQRNASQGVEE